MAGRADAAPVIIKRKKVVSDGGSHHGGAWKVAYADFVTAMMAFFMLLWLLNATTQKQRKGIADYFNPTIPINRISGGGDGAFGGSSVFTQKTLAQVGSGATAMVSTASHAARGETQPKTGKNKGASASQQQAQVMKSVQRTLIAKGGESQTMQHLLRHVVTRVTPEGLVIELFDTPGEPLFEKDTTTPTDTMRSLATLMAQVLAIAKNGIDVGGFVRSYPITQIRNPAWPLSSGRAEEAHRLMVAAGLDDSRIERVAGHADRTPAVANATAIRNNRIEVVLIRTDR